MHFNYDLTSLEFCGNLIYEYLKKLSQTSCKIDKLCKKLKINVEHFNSTENFFLLLVFFERKIKFFVLLYLILNVI